MEQEILNIEYHRVRLIVKSLNLSRDKRDAAQKCGLSVKSLYQYIRIYDIVKENKNWIQRRKIII